MACSKWIPNVGRKRCTRHFAKRCLSVEQHCWKQHNGLLPLSFAIVAAQCCWAISCFMCGTCWAEAGADTGPSSSCAWIDTSPVVSCFSPVPDAKSSLLMVCDFLRDARWHGKLKHSQEHLEAAGFYFYMDLTCHLSVLSVVSGWQFNITLVVFCGCCLQHSAFRRWSCRHWDLFRQSHQPLSGCSSFLCAPFPFESLVRQDASCAFTQGPQAQISWDFISDISRKHILIFKDMCCRMLCNKHRNKNHRVI